MASLKVKDGTTWKSAIPWVKDGSTWKKPKTLWVKDGGTWKAVWSAFSVSLSTTSISSSGSSGSQTTGSVTVTASGGSGSYSYSWVFEDSSGGHTITSPSSATTTFSKTGMVIGESYVSTVYCNVTDTSSGSVVASGLVSVSTTRI